MKCIYKQCLKQRAEIEHFVENVTFVSCQCNLSPPFFPRPLLLTPPHCIVTFRGCIVHQGIVWIVRPPIARKPIYLKRPDFAFTHLVHAILCAERVPIVNLGRIYV